MAIITPPSKGSPVDVELLAQMVEEINSLRSAISGDSVSKSSINRVPIDTFGKLAFFSDKEKINVSPVADGQRVYVSFSFTSGGVQFSGIPNITVGVKNVNQTEAGYSVIPAIDTADGSSCTVALTFKTNGDVGALLEVSVIAIGKSL